jgi:hypothetical protein
MDTENPFPLIGTHWRENDKRDTGRTIRLTGFATDKLGYEAPGKYRYVVLANENDPSRIGHTGKIKVTTLDEHWTKVSH